MMVSLGVGSLKIGRILVFIKKKPSMIETFKLLYGEELAKKISDRDAKLIDENLERAKETAKEFIRNLPQTEHFVND